MARRAMVALCAVGLTSPVCRAGSLPIYGGATFDGATGTGYKSLGIGDGWVREGLAAATVGKIVANTSRGERAARWSTVAGPEILGDLGTNQFGNTSALVGAINDAGVVVGSASKWSGNDPLGSRAVRWPSGSSVAIELDHLGSDPLGATESEARAINFAGVTVGFADKYTSGAFRGPRAVKWDAGGTALVELPNLGLDSAGNTRDTSATFILDNGTIFGYAGKHQGGSFLGVRAVRWDAAGNSIQELPSLVNSASADNWIHHVNGDGLAVGYSAQSSGRSPVRWDANAGSMMELESLGTNADGQRRGEALAINASGLMTGFVLKYVNQASQGMRAVRWDSSGAVEELPSFVADGTSRASGISDSGIIVGSAEMPDGFEHAAVWFPGQAMPTELISLIDPGSGWQSLFRPTRMDGDWIVGAGIYDPDGAGPLHPYTRDYLIQLPEPQLGAGAAWVLAMCIRRHRRHRFPADLRL